jgi:hypothetical protein
MVHISRSGKSAVLPFGPPPQRHLVVIFGIATTSNRNLETIVSFVSNGSQLTLICVIYLIVTASNLDLLEAIQYWLRRIPFEVMNG